MKAGEKGAGKQPVNLRSLLLSFWAEEVEESEMS